MGWYLTFILGPQNSFPLSLTTKHFLGDLWIITSEEEESRRQRKKQHKKKQMGWAVPALSNRKLNPKAWALHILGPWMKCFIHSFHNHEWGITSMAQDRDTLQVHELLAEFWHPFTSASQTSVPATTVSFPWRAHPQSSWCLPQSLVTCHLGRFYINFRLLAWTFSSLNLLPFNSGGGWAYDSALLLYLITPYDVCPWLVLGRGT